MLLFLLAAATASASPPLPTAMPTPAAAAVGATTAATPDSGMVVEEDWTATADAPLSATLAGWAERAGWKLVWESDSDFRLAAGATITGDFPSAAGQLIDAFSHTRPRLRAVFYAGNKVLRVWTERTEP